METNPVKATIPVSYLTQGLVSTSSTPLFPCGEASSLAGKGRLLFFEGSNTDDSHRPTSLKLKRNPKSTQITPRVATESKTLLKRAEFRSQLAHGDSNKRQVKLYKTQTGQRKSRKSILSESNLDLKAEVAKLKLRLYHLTFENQVLS